ncbi:TetR/AcrR family transcriptional regulator [soil metagenome]
MATPRKRRSDAEQNRERIVSSARRIYRESGPTASLDAIAADAGVGNATLYRHFPDRSQLRTTVLTERIEEVSRFLSTLENETDGWAALERYVRFLAATPDNTLVDVLVSPPTEPVEVAAYRRDIRPRVQLLLDRAKQSGAIRPDYTIDDMNIFLFAHTSAHFSPRVDADGAQRLLEDYLRGIDIRHR